MRIGLMIGPERGRYRTKVERLLADARWAEEAGLATVWIPQIPDEFDALTAATVVGTGTSRIEIGTAVVPVQPRHPIALAQHILSVQAVCEGRLAIGLGVSHHWIIDEMLGLPYEHPVATMRAYLDVLDRALAGPGPVDVENEHVPGAQPPRHHRRQPHPGPAGRAGAAHARSCAASGPTGPSCGWPTSGPSAPTSCPRSPAPPRTPAGRPRGSWPGSRCACAATTRSTPRWHGPTGSYPRPRSRPTTRSCWSRVMPGASVTSWWREARSTIRKRLTAFADAGVTDLSVRVVPIGDGRDELIASSKRTRRLLASLADAVLSPDRRRRRRCPPPSLRVGAGAAAGAWRAAPDPTPGSGPARCRTADRARGRGGRSGGRRAQW